MGGRSSQPRAGADPEPQRLEDGSTGASASPATPHGSEVTTSGVMRTVDLALSCFQHDEVLAAVLATSRRGVRLRRHDREERRRSSPSARTGPAGWRRSSRPLRGARRRSRAAGSSVPDAPARPADALSARRGGRDRPPPGPAGPSSPTGEDGASSSCYAMQSFSQAQSRWGREGAETLANATTATCVLGGLKVADDLRELSRLCGSRKVLRHTSLDRSRTGGRPVALGHLRRGIGARGERHQMPARGRGACHLGAAQADARLHAGQLGGTARRTSRPAPSASPAGRTTRRAPRHRRDERAAGAVLRGSAPPRGVAIRGPPADLLRTTRHPPPVELARSSTRARRRPCGRSSSEFVAFLNRRYVERAEQRVPPCWAEHGALVEELTTLYLARWQAFESRDGSVGGAQFFHSQTLPGFLDRMTRWISPDRLRKCQAGRHEPRVLDEPVEASAWEFRRHEIAAADLALRQPARRARRRRPPGSPGPGRVTDSGEALRGATRLCQPRCRVPSRGRRDRGWGARTNTTARQRGQPCMTDRSRGALGLRCTGRLLDGGRLCEKAVARRGTRPRWGSQRRSSWAS